MTGVVGAPPAGISTVAGPAAGRTRRRVRRCAGRVRRGPGRVVRPDDEPHADRDDRPGHDLTGVVSNRAGDREREHDGQYCDGDHCRSAPALPDRHRGRVVGGRQQPHQQVGGYTDAGDGEADRDEPDDPHVDVQLAGDATGNPREPAVRAAPAIARERVGWSRKRGRWDGRRRIADRIGHRFVHADILRATGPAR